MLSSINNISVSYDPINEQNTFSEGDVISGRVVVVTTKETKIRKLSVKVHGKAEVHWSTGSGDDSTDYDATEVLLKLKQVLSVHGDTDKDALAAGANVYPFTFQIPPGSLPSTFKGAHGEIAYRLEAKLSRSMRIPSTATAKFTFVSKSHMGNPQMKEPQCGTVSKKMSVFTSGNASLSATMDRMAYLLGEGVKVTAEIENSSSRPLAPKFSLYQQQSFFARGSKNVSVMYVRKEVGQPVPSRSKQTVTQTLNIPCDLPASIHNCSILKVEYGVKVYLDVPYAKDPEIKFPLVVLPEECASFLGVHPSMPSDFGCYSNAGMNAYPGPIFPTPQTYPPLPPMQPNLPYPTPDMFTHPNVPGSSPLCNINGQFPPPTAPGVPEVPPPYSAIGQFPPPTAPAVPEAPPLYSAIGPFPPHTVPQVFPFPTGPEAPPPYSALNQFPDQTGPVQVGMYPSLSDTEEKKPL